MINIFKNLFEAVTTRSPSKENIFLKALLFILNLTVNLIFMGIGGMIEIIGSNAVISLFGSLIFFYLIKIVNLYQVIWVTKIFFSTGIILFIGNLFRL